MSLLAAGQTFCPVPSSPPPKLGAGAFGAGIEETSTRTAYHEAGHAVADTILGVVVTRVTITPVVGLYRGCCDVTLPPQHRITAKQWDRQQRRTLVSLLAGPFAAWQLEGKLNMDGSDDAAKVIRIVKSLYPDAPQAEQHRFLGNISIVSRRLLLDAAAWRAVEAVANALLKYHTLSRPMLMVVLHEALPPPDRARLADFTARKLNFLQAAMSDFDHQGDRA